MDKIISINNLCISFKNTEVLNRVNLNIIKGKTTAIVGESGSGKTLTALSILKLLPNNAKLHLEKYILRIKIYYLKQINLFKKLEGIKSQLFSKSP